MEGETYQLWLNYHYGLIQRELTKEEYSEIRACEFAMHFLIPDEYLLKECGGYNKLSNITLSCEDKFVKNLAERFKVPIDVMLIKIADLIKRNQESKKETKGWLKRKIDLSKKNLQ